MDNNQQLKLDQKAIEVAQQQTEVYKLNQLPNVSAGLAAFYLGDIAIRDSDFSFLQTVEAPHFGNTFSLQAQQLIYGAGIINNTLKVGSLQEQMAQLSLENDEISIKYLVISNYLKLYKLHNQKQVFLENIKLADKRIANVNSFYNQGMVTKNEVIRGDLLLASLNQAIITIDNNIAILNKQLTTAIGLPENTEILPAEETLTMNPLLQDYQLYKEEILNSHPLIETIDVQRELAVTSLDITKAERMPKLVGFAGYDLMRPLTNSFPLQDVYSRSWQIGVSLNYNIESLYKNKDKEALDQLKIEQVEEAKTYTEQNLEVAIKAAYLKYQEAVAQKSTYAESKRLAEENYKIIEKKYLNQLALITDMLDASNAKLDADLQYVNAEINIISAYYNILKTVGKL
jgi:outer membrane protein TolC